jgi:drug/metabolite transporter (DMT)-like permease
VPAFLRRQGDERLGIVLVTTAAMAWSTAGYFTRLIPVGLWTMLVWRNVFGAAFITLYLAAIRRRAVIAGFAQLGAVGWFAAAVNGLSMICFLAALRRTSVANVAIIYATAPFIAAAIAWVGFRDAASRRTLLAGLLALMGVAITVGGAPHAGALSGDLLAILMTIGLSTFTVIVRHHRNASMVSAAAASAWLGALIGLPFASSLAVGTHQLTNLALFGVTSFGLGLVLYTIGARRLHPSRAALISALETPLAPIWVWLAFDQKPAAASFVGGAIVIVAVLANILRGQAPAPTPLSGVDAAPAGR